MQIYPSIKNRLLSQHQTIRELIRNFDEVFVSKIPDTGKWSIKENLVHIVSYHQVFLNRLDKIIKTDNPYFKRYSFEDDKNFDAMNKLHSSELLIRLEEERQKVIDVINKLKYNELQRTGIHQKFGVMNIVEWIEFFLLHESHHIYTIFRLARSD